MFAAADHAILNYHTLDFVHVEVVDHEWRAIQRKVKEALHIVTEKKMMNKDNGLELDPIWFSLISESLANQVLTLFPSYVVFIDITHRHRHLTHPTHTSHL